MGASLPFLVTILSALLFSDGGVPVETASLQFEQLKAGMKSAWMAGDFGEVAKFTSAEAENFVARIGIQPGARVLDVACGTGNTAIPAARGGAEVTGVDIATNFLAQAEKRAKVEGLRAHFQEGDAEHLPFGDSEFDVVLSMYGAMFAPRPDRVAAELVPVCKPGGNHRNGKLDSRRFRWQECSRYGKTRPAASWSSRTRSMGRRTGRSPTV